MLSILNQPLPEMESFDQISQSDLECRVRISGGGSDRESLWFTDDDEGSFCILQLFSTQDDVGLEDDGVPIPDPGKVCSVECSIFIEDDEDEKSRGEAKMVCLADAESESTRECRICQLTLESSSVECETAIELGCSCKDDLGAAHKHCAETWFSIKGNRTCEICNSIAHNVFPANQSGEMAQQQQRPQLHDQTNVTTVSNNYENSASSDLIGLTDHDHYHYHRSSYSNGHRLVNFLLSCIVFAFSISWLFHLNVPS